MDFLVDTNILCRLAQPDASQHDVARMAVRHLLALNAGLFISPQIEREFWVVVTRPREQNGLGMSPPEASTCLHAFSEFLVFNADNAAVHGQWQRLVTEYAVIGKQAHDAGHVAAMMAHGITNVLTFDEADFQRYEPLIRVWTPEQVVRQSQTGAACD